MESQPVPPTPTPQLSSRFDPWAELYVRPSDLAASAPSIDGADADGLRWGDGAADI